MYWLDLWETFSYEDLPVFKRKLLVFVNPHSGRNQAVKNWNKAKKLLSMKFFIKIFLKIFFVEKAGCEFQEIFTQYSGHAKEFIFKYPSESLKEIDGLVTVSGDGLLHEIINGIFCLESLNLIFI